MRVRQRIAHDRLEYGPGKSQIHADQCAGHSPRQADIPDNLAQSAVIGDKEKLQGFCRCDRSRPLGDRQDDTAQSQHGKGPEQYEPFQPAPPHQ